jgi:nitrate/nitrite transport system ATP-binding protein
MAFLELKNVCKGYGVGARRCEILNDINLSISEGEFVAIVGYSGAGKTTLMSLMAGLQRPDEGTVTLRGEVITEPGPDRAIVFQNYSLLPWLSVQDNIALAVDEVFATWPSDRRRAHVQRYIALVNLTEARDKKPLELSGGMRQRVSVARALAMNPRILLLDEPLSALDALTRATLQDEIGRIWAEDRKTVVLITNDVDEGILLADRIIPLSAGPGATLGPSISIEINRPRNRKALNHDPRFKEIRREVIAYLLGSGGKPTTTLTRKLVLPDIEPEDLNAPSSMITRRRTPVRRSEIKRETVGVPHGNAAPER